MRNMQEVKFKDEILGARILELNFKTKIQI